MLYLACSEILIPVCYLKVKIPKQSFLHTCLPAYRPVLPISQTDAFMVSLLNTHKAQIPRPDLVFTVSLEVKPPASTRSTIEQSQSPVFSQLLSFLTAPCHFSACASAPCTHHIPRRQIHAAFWSIENFRGACVVLWDVPSLQCSPVVLLSTRITPGF